MKEKEKPLLTIKTKYNVIYNFLNKHATTFVIIVFILIVLIAQKELVEYGVLILVIYLIYLILITIYNKRKARESIYNFYENRLEYNKKINNDDLEKVLYTDITQINYSQTFSQSVFKIGTITIYTKNEKITKRLIIINEVRDVKFVYEKILEILGEKEEQ